MTREARGFSRVTVGFSSYDGEFRLPLVLAQDHARGEGERVLALESREGTRASRRVEEGLSRSLSGGGGISHTIVLAWRIPGTGEPGGLPSMGSHRVGHD